MNFFFEFFTCCGPRQPASSRSTDDKRLLVAPGTSRSMSRKLEGVIDDSGGYGDHHEWKPSLLSISEDDVFTEVSCDDNGQPAAERGRSLKTQVSSSSPRRGSGSSSNSHIRRAPVSTIVRPTLLSSRSFMF